MRGNASILIFCLGLGCGGGTGDGASATDSGGSTSSATDGSATGTGTDSGAGSTGEVLEGYDDPALWLCHPDKTPEDDQCLGNDLTATEILPDGSTQVVPHVVAEDPGFDCFYVYPTVDIRLQPGQTEDFDDITQELDPLLSQAARFTSMCRVFAPLYHQITFGTFGSDQEEDLLEAAYQDIEAAFTSYLERHAGDRPFVIMGHSQGTRMTTSLIQRVIEPNPQLRGRMIVALLIGGGTSVPVGEVVGGTFTEIPVCTAPEQTGCIMGYRTYAASLPPDDSQSAPAGHDLVCTNPAAADGSKARLGGAYFANFAYQPGVFPAIDFGMTIDTPFVLYRDLYTAECQTDSNGLSFLAVAPEPEMGDSRVSPIDIDDPLLGPGFLGLHVLDYNYPQQELLDLVALKAAQ